MSATKKPFIFSDIAKKIGDISSPMIVWLAKKGLTANILTFLQFPFIFFTFYFFVIDNITGVIVSLFIVLFLDVADGTFARVTGTTSKRGHILDKSVDLISITVFIVGLILYLPDEIFLLTVILMLSFFIYALNEFTNIQIVGGVRSLGLVGLIVDEIKLAIYLILIISVGGLLYKIGEFLLKRKNEN